jgi:Domain of unknown function (DUF3850)
MVVHELKSWPCYFEPVISGHKSFELRINDRQFAVGDVLWLREYNDKTEQYSGREIRKRVTYLLEGGAYILGGHNPEGMPPTIALLKGYAIMSLEDFNG